MTISKKSIRNINLQSKTVLLRVDYNVPFDPKTREILDLTRIISTIPTIDFLLKTTAK